MGCADVVSARAPCGFLLGVKDNEGPCLAGDMMDPGLPGHEVNSDYPPISRRAYMNGLGLFDHRGAGNWPHRPAGWTEAARTTGFAASFSWLGRTG